ncbi:MAG: PepSY domain-containing protein [Cypionkella sp.]|jgi:hypothetical protein|nr:PepSY domain-containing protein [Cypionkella sp.]
MRLTFAALVLGAVIAGSAALALTPEQVVSDLQAQGYTRVEVRIGPTQMKVEAIRGTEKLEVIYDRSTGSVLKTERERVEPDDSTTPGVSVRERGRDFVRVRGERSSDDDGSDDRGDDDRSDDDRSDDDRGDDDKGGDRGGDRGGHGSDDDGDDDRGGHGDDHGGDSDDSDDDSDDGDDDSSGHGSDDD